MRVLHTIGSVATRYGGPARSVPALVGALDAQGLDVSIWSADESKTECCTYQSGKILEVIKRCQPDIVHDHGVWLPNNFLVARICRKLGIPRVVSPRGMLMPWALNHHRWKKRAAWWGYQRKDFLSASAVHATGEPEAEQVRALGFQGQLIVAPNGVAVPESPGVLPSIEPRRALFLSRIHPKKGLMMLAEAWAAVRPTGWTLQVVGPDERGHRADLERRASELGLLSSWSFRDEAGNAEKWELLGQAELFILPTFSENFGIVVAEALGVGTPVITTTGTPWLDLDRRNCGWCIEPNVESLVVALRTATACSPHELQMMGARGRAWILESFSSPAAAAIVARGYQEILSVR